MRLNLLASMIWVLAATAGWTAARGEQEGGEKGIALMKAESVGGVKMEMTAAAVKKLLGEPDAIGKDEQSEAVGLYVQSWSWKKKGLHLQMGSESKGGRKTVYAIEVVSPSEEGTAKGVRIGSTEAAAKKAYAAYQDQEASKAGKILVAGTVYGGVIFTIEGGKVRKIFIGATAE